MQTNTPRNDQGQFVSWNTKIQEANQQGLNQFNGRDAAIGAAVTGLAIGAWHGCKLVYKKIKEDRERMQRMGRQYRAWSVWIQQNDPSLCELPFDVKRRIESFDKWCKENPYG